ncbi:hypothetical protein JMJ35_007809 [Cladonia borealis]|uniref:FAD/NAD(P)-binding domain-containing protein n=1 Tax=Cladonia borealis TaxID=184061 RepID=A0AA39V734_9LECA|nr:hypothetical protein JMJ35_007809 [Cladonia borealis]
MESLLDISDVLILGGSHAGLSVAVALHKALHTCIIFNTHQPRNRCDTPVYIVPTWGNESAEEKCNASRAGLQKCGSVHFIDFGVETVPRTFDGLIHVTDSQEKVAGKKTLLAIGSHLQVNEWLDLLSAGSPPIQLQIKLNSIPSNLDGTKRN